MSGSSNLYIGALLIAGAELTNKRDCDGSSPSILTGLSEVAREFGSIPAPMPID